MAVVELPTPTVDARRVRLRGALRRFPLGARVATVILVAFVVIAVTGPAWAPYGPTVSTPAGPFTDPSHAHLLGTDVLGRDVFSRLVYGTRDVLLLALVSTALSTIVGGALGLLSGYVGGSLDQLLMRAFEAVISIPLLVLALLAVAAAGPKLAGSKLLLIGVIILVYAPRTARMARAVAVELGHRDFVVVARARGESVWSIVRRELAPNATGVLLVEFGVRAGYAPILISSLGFLGFGEQPPAPDWGLMISENRQALSTAPVSVLAPAATLAVLVIALNVATDGLARVLGRAALRTP